MEEQDYKSRGELRISHIFNADDIGVSVPEPHPDRALRIFLDLASPSGHRAIAPRVSQLPRAVLLLQSVQGEPASGAIYLYVRETGEFYIVEFDGGDEAHLTVGEYETLVHEYGLLEYAAEPELIKALSSLSGLA